MFLNYRNFWKRLIDIIIGFFLLILVSPILFFFAILIKIESKGSVFYLQSRLGKNKKVFTLYKLRSLKTNENRSHLQIYNNHPDMTSIGRFIRRYKIDELPQIFNVIIGDMSLIGPRPCLPDLMKEFDANAFKRFEVRPGLSGWAQVNGNINISWTERWVFDKYYVENMSFFFDCKIIWKTFFVIIFGE
jgi:lipopolysaccharide/colanic/teichoic acid biosynthesis glycosyltransferase